MKLGLVDYDWDPTPHDNFGGGNTMWVVCANICMQGLVPNDSQETNFNRVIQILTKDRYQSFDTLFMPVLWTAPIHGYNNNNITNSSSTDTLEQSYLPVTSGSSGAAAERWPSMDSWRCHTLSYQLPLKLSDLSIMLVLSSSATLEGAFLKCLMTTMTAPSCSNICRS